MYHGERFNSITHLIGGLLAIAGAAVLITFASLYGDAWKIVGTTIYSIGMVMVYAMSTLYHATPGPWKMILRKFDYISIYVMIAGTYTPFCLVSLRGPSGWALFIAVWAITLVGIIWELFRDKHSYLPSLLMYLFMSGLIVVALRPLAMALPTPGMLWLSIGGFLYLSGLGFFIFDDRVPHFHGIWHLFVIGGTACQYFCILLYVAM